MSTYAEMRNSLFGRGALLNSQGAFSGGSFAGAEFATLSPHSPFSLTETIIIQQRSRGNTTFGTVAVDPPARIRVSGAETGSTLTLLGLAIVGIEAVGRRWGVG
jgi:hypothetical protein